MRTATTLLLASLLLLALAGCTQPAASPSLPPVAPRPAQEAPRPQGVNVTTAPEDASATVDGCQIGGANCMFQDAQYHEYVLYSVDTPHLPVVIVPPASPRTGEVEQLRDAVVRWGEGVKAFGASWLRGNFSLDVYVLGQDTPPADILRTVKIVVLASEVNPGLLFGIGLEPGQTACSAIGQKTLRTYPVHAHDGIEVHAMDCTGTGFLCFAVNTSDALEAGAASRISMQDLVAHEVGHCLGGGHVGDALDFGARATPRQDIMSYEHGDHVHCVSNLNVRVLEGVYAPLIRGSDVKPLKPGDYLSMDRAAYRHVLCPSPV